MSFDSLGNRIKDYERTFATKLPRRLPVIMRLDGKAFHTLTKKWFKGKPFDHNFTYFMNETARYLCQNIQGAQLAYVQSDEISILIHNYKKFNSEPWFDNKIQKMCSVSGAMAASFFTKGCYMLLKKFDDIVCFDSRVFVLPEAEVANYFVWRQNDWTRNSVQMMARSLYSNKECFKKNSSELQGMIFEKNQNWDSLDVSLKRGRCIVKNNSEKRSIWILDLKIPIFTQDRNYIETLLEVEEK